MDGFLFYYLGLYFGNIVKNKRFNIIKLLIIYYVFVAIQIVEGYGWYKLGSDNCGTQLKISALLTNTIFAFMAYWYINNRKISGDSKLFVIIGDYSFGIYLAHIAIITLLSNIIPFWSSIPFGLNSVIVLSVTLLCVILGRRISGKRVSRWLGLV